MIMYGACLGAQLALPAWYGKLPGAGDFVGRRMQGALARTWEQWLSQGMASGRANLDAQAPLWCFAIPAGSGDGWVQLGCVAPSHDRVGRRYPLVVAQPFAPAGYVRENGQGAPAGQGARACPDVRIRLMGAIVRDAIRGALGPEDFDLALAQGLRDGAAAMRGDASREGAGMASTASPGAVDSIDPIDSTDTVGRTAAHASTGSLAGAASGSGTAGAEPSAAGGWPNLWEYFDPNGMTSFWWTDAGDGAPRTDVHTGGLDAALFQRLFGEPGGGRT
jgi:type VI secretion system protein ImpM